MTDSLFMSDPFFIEARKKAMAITEKTYQGQPGTGYQYFRKKEGIENPISKNIVVLFVAVEFLRQDAHFLQSYFEHEACCYGLVHVSTNNNLLPKEQFIANYRATRVQPTNLLYLPYAVQARIIDYYGATCDFYFDHESRTAYSGLDMKFGAHEIDHRVKSRLVKDPEQCALFFNTKAAYLEIEKWLTKTELKAWKTKLDTVREQCLAEDLETCVYAEKPYSLVLQGTDDASWSKNFATKEEVSTFIKEMTSAGSACTQLMVFTN